MEIQTSSSIFCSFLTIFKEQLYNIFYLNDLLEKKKKIHISKVSKVRQKIICPNVWKKNWEKTHPIDLETQGHGRSVRKGNRPFFHKTAAFRPTISFSPFLIKEEFALLDRGRRRRRYPPRQFRCFVKADTTGCTRGPSRNPSFLSHWPPPPLSLSLPVSPLYRSSPRASGLA